MKDVILGVVGDGVGIGVGAGVKVGVGLGVGVGEGVGVGVGAGEGLEVGSGVGVNEGVGVGEGTGVGVGVGDGVGSGISPLVPLLMLPNRERDDCVSAGLITLTKHTVITTKVPTPLQLHFSFILSMVLSLVSSNFYYTTFAFQYQLSADTLSTLHTGATSTLTLSLTFHRFVHQNIYLLLTLFNYIKCSRLLYITSNGNQLL